MSNQVSVLRLSHAGISSATWKIFPPGIAEWAKNTGADFCSYPYIELNGNKDVTAAKVEKALIATIGRLPKEGMLVIGVPGPVKDNRINFCPQLSFIEGDFLPDILKKHWQIGLTCVFNNSNLWAEAELHQGVLTSNFTGAAALVTIGRGLGMSLIINGKVFHGDRGFAGEIGHVSIDANGPKCQCGQQGCLEFFASGDGLMRQAVEKGIGISKPSDLQKIPEASSLIGRAREILVNQIACAIVPLDIQQIILGGYLASLFNKDMIEELLNQKIPQFMRPVRVAYAAYSAFEGSLLGGGLVGFDLQGHKIVRLRVPSLNQE